MIVLTLFPYIAASEKSTRGISLVDREYLLTQSTTIHGSEPPCLYLDAFQRALTTDPLADSDEEMDRPDDADGRRMDHIDRSKRLAPALPSLRLTEQGIA